MLGLVPELASQCAPAHVGTTPHRDERCDDVFTLATIWFHKL